MSCDCHHEPLVWCPHLKLWVCRTTANLIAAADLTLKEGVPSRGKNCLIARQELTALRSWEIPWCS